MFSPSELAANYADIGIKKAAFPVWKLIMSGAIAGFFVGMGSAVSNMAVHSIDNVSVSRIICGLLFPFGLGMVMLLGAELFLGNSMIFISVLEKKVSVGGMFRNWGCVYLGNFTGAVLLAAACAFFGHLNYSDGGLAVYTIKVAAAKCSISFLDALVMGICCNLLVCTAVLCSLSATDTAGKIIGAYIPIAYFVICGFENSVANMYYIAAGLFAMGIPSYAADAIKMNIYTDLLTWPGFLLRNLLPVSIGNIIGGIGISLFMWLNYLKNTSK